MNRAKKEWLRRRLRRAAKSVVIPGGMLKRLLGTMKGKGTR